MSKNDPAALFRQTGQLLQKRNYPQLTILAKSLRTSAEYGVMLRRVMIGYGSSPEEGQKALRPVLWRLARYADLNEPFAKITQRDGSIKKVTLGEHLLHLHNSQNR